MNQPSSCRGRRFHDFQRTIILLMIIHHSPTCCAFTARLPQRYSSSFGKWKRPTMKRRRRPQQPQPQRPPPPPNYQEGVSALSYQDGTSSIDDSSSIPQTNNNNNNNTPLTQKNWNDKQQGEDEDDEDSSTTCSSSTSSTKNQVVDPQQPPLLHTPQTREEKDTEMEGSPSSSSSWFQIWKLYGSCLFQLCRPSNFVGVLVFHMLGTHLALLSLGSSSASALQLVWKEPSMWNTLFILLGITSTSMMVNDYYDTKLGVDAARVDRPLQQPPPEVGGEVNPPLPLWVVKKCLVGGYGLLLPAITWMPSVLARTTAMLSVMFTFWYTRHLKPKTWIKNVTCASIMALAPLTSGAVAASIVNTNGATSSLSLLLASGGITKLGQLVLLLFFGFMGREITMDCQDVREDAQHHIQTIPVQYGTKFASQIALGCYTLMAMVTVGGKVAAAAAAGQQGWLSPLVQMGLATIGSLRMLQRAWQVYRTQGRNTRINGRAIEEGKTTMLLLLASFM